MTVIEFVYSTRTFSLSLTGAECALDCAHCSGHYLEHMHTPGNLPPNPEDYTSCLVSGGCVPGGEVPLADHTDTLMELSSRFRLVAHTGLISAEDARLVAPYIDAASFNLVGSDIAVREVLGLRAGASDFFDSYRALKRCMDAVYPHITLGLKGGEFSGEYDALDFLAREGPPALVVNVFMPTPGTRYADREPPGLDCVKSFVKGAMERLECPIYVGCMRPPGAYRAKMDRLMVELGVHRIVKPADPAVELARELGLDIIRRDECCVL